MRRALLRVPKGLVCVLVVSLCGTGLVHAKESEGERAFWGYVERLGRDLDFFWNDELNTAANAVLQDQNVLRSIKFTGVDQNADVNQRCEIIPKADLATGTVRFDRRELIGMSFANSYPLLAYLVGSEVVSKPEDVDLFVRETIRPYFRQLINACIDADHERIAYQWDDLRVISIYRDVAVDVIQRDVQRVALRSGQSLNDRELHHFLAAFPIAFVLLHEAGHIARSEEELSPMEIEEQADAFAAGAFRASGVPATLGIPFLQMFGARISEREMNCRLSRIAEADQTQDWTAIKLNTTEVARLEELRVYYLRTYQKDCI